MKDYPWPEPCVPHASKELAHAIGVININWNWCEFLLEHILGTYIGTQQRVADRLISPLGARTRCDILTGLVKELETDDARAKCVLHFIACFDICRENRNLLTHGLCVDEYPDLDGPALVSHKAAIDIFDRAAPVSVDLLLTTINETRTLFEFGFGIIDAGYLGADDQPEPLPKKPPLPRKLTKLLPAQIIERLQPES